MEAFLVNPPRRRRDSKGRYVKRSKATRRRRRSRRNPGVESLMLLNPPRRRRRGRRTVSRRRRRVSVALSRVGRRIRRAYRRSAGARGGSLSMGSIFSLAKEGAFLAAGAVITTQIYTRFMPDSVKAQRGVNHLARAAVAVLGGYAISRFLSRRLGHAFTLGGLTSTIIVAGNDFLGPAAVPLGGMEEMALGAYYTSMNGLGDYYSPAPAFPVGSQPDSLAWESGVPERLDPSSRF